MAKCRANVTLQYIKRICTVCCQSASLRNRHALEPSCGACCRRVYPERDSDGISYPESKRGHQYEYF